MTNGGKHKFIQSSYIYTRLTELWSEVDAESMTRKWFAKMLLKITMQLYKHRSSNDNNLAMLKNKSAWFSCPITWNDSIDVTISYDRNNSRGSEMSFYFCGKKTNSPGPRSS